MDGQGPGLRPSQGEDSEDKYKYAILSLSHILESKKKQVKRILNNISYLISYAHYLFNTLK